MEAVLVASVGFSYHNNPHFTGQRTNVGIAPAAEYIYSNDAFLELGR